MSDHIHHCEPSLETLKETRKALFASESTDENIKKIKAIERQITRHEAVEAEKKAAEKAAKTAEKKK